MIPHNPDWAVWTRWPSRRLACGLSRGLALKDELGNSYTVFLSSPTWKIPKQGSDGQSAYHRDTGMGCRLNKTLTEAFCATETGHGRQAGQQKWAWGEKT